MNLENYQLRQKLHESDNSIVYRGVRSKDEQPVIIKILNQAYPSSQQLARFQREYLLTEKLATVKGVVNVYDFVNGAFAQAIVEEDIGGVDLKKLSKMRQFLLKDILIIGIELSDILWQVHQNQIVHKDITLANIIYNWQTEKVQLIDFGIASELEREKFPANLATVEGTVFYISPEQTGRINRSVDYRSDFYSLGVSLYELLTGEVPFQGADFLEVVHGHLAKSPISPSIKNPAIPAYISDVVLKLLAKDVRNRYQSAVGLKQDLEQCLNFVTSAVLELDFSFATHDVSHYLRISEQLYGREKELIELENLLEYISGGESAIALISGTSGSGKSSLVAELNQNIFLSNGFVTQGKFDQLQRVTPYQPILDAFQRLIQQILLGDIVNIDYWRRIIQANLGDQGKVITDLIPDLQKLIGVQPDLPELKPQEEQNRFYYVFQQFLNSFTKTNHPFVLFLDDMQWADPSSLQLLEHILFTQKNNYFYFIAAYRDDEISSTHPVTQYVKKAEKNKSLFKQFHLDNLELSDVEELVADTFRAERQEVSDLSFHLWVKTQGNPFFVKQLMSELFHQKLIYFDHINHRWSWHIDQISNILVSDNVVKFMSHKLQELPQETLDLLKIASVIDFEFELNQLSQIVDGDSFDLYQQLWPALKQGVLLPIDGNYKLMQNNAFQGDVSFRFLHDKVKQSAYELLSDNDCKLIHLKIARQIFQAGEIFLPETIFNVADHFNASISLIDEAERFDIALLNSRAAQVAQKATAYIPAFQYAKNAVSLWSDIWWHQEAEKSLDIYTTAVLAAHLTQNYEEMNQWVKIATEKSDSIISLVTIHETLARAYIAQDNVQQAILTGVDFVKKLGIDLPLNPTEEDIGNGLFESQRIVGGKNFEDLYQLNEMTDPRHLAIMRILTSISSAAFFGNPALFPLVCFEQVKLSVQFGHAPESAYAYSLYASVVSSFLKDFEQASFFGELAIYLVEHIPTSAQHSRVMLVYDAQTRHLQHPLKMTLPSLLDAHQIGLNHGDLEFAAYSGEIYCFHAFNATAIPLSKLEEDMKMFAKFMQFHKQYTALNVHVPTQQVVHNLYHLVEEPTKLNGPHAYEDKLLDNFVKTNDYSGLAMLHYNKLLICYLFGSYEEAVYHGQQMDVYGQSALTMYNKPAYYYYYCLSLLSIHSILEGKEQDDCWCEIERIRDEYQHWCVHSPSNHKHKGLIIDAQMSILNGDIENGISLLKQAIKIALAEGFVQDKGIAEEILGELFIKLEDVVFGRAYLQEARFTYLKWGAVNKVRFIDEKFKHLLIHDSMGVHKLVTSGNRLGETTSRHQYLDIQTILKAVETISAEIRIDKLLTKMIRIIMENAGAQNGYLFFVDGQEINLQAAAFADSSEISLFNNLSLSKNKKWARKFPMTLFKYLLYNKNPILLSDLTEEHMFKHDDYLQYDTPFSILALPILNKKELMGIIYLENRLLSVSFGRDQVQILSLLTTQMGISIENARLYEETERARKQAIDLQEEVATAYNVTIQGWSKALELRDQETKGHSERVTQLTIAFAKEVGFSEAEMEPIYRGAILHDIGKMAIPDKILLKKGSLSKEERKIMEHHTTFAYEWLSNIQYLHSSLDIPLYHHEKWDGSGYPYGLKGEDIPLSARIFAIVDVWDALTSDRPYRNAWPREKVEQYLKDQAGLHFDPYLVDLFLKMAH